MLFVCSESGIQWERVKAHQEGFLLALSMENLKLTLWIEIGGDVDTQGAMSFIDGLLNELFRCAGWCGLDEECCRVVHKLA